jgi:branched-chain amino acid aminotransferase
MAIVYFDGRFLDESQAHVPLTTHALHYGTAVFEGIRSYGDGDRASIFRAREHYERLLRNASLLEMRITTSVDEFVAITIDLLRKNSYFDNRYIRPIIFKNSQKIGAGLPEGECIAILAQTMPHAPATRVAVRATWSHWRRFPAAACPAGAKITGLYVNSSLARADALARGYDQPIMLTMSGDVAEGYGANLFAVFGKRVVTPPPEADILSGITRDTLIEYFMSRADLSMSVESVRPEQLQTADEVFFCGTGMEMLPVGEIEGRRIGDGKTAGAITSDAVSWYQDVVTGKNPKYAHWLTPVTR